MSLVINGNRYQHAELFVGVAPIGAVKAINYRPRENVSHLGQLKTLIAGASFTLTRGMTVAIYDAMGIPPTTRYWRRRLTILKVRARREHT